MNTRKARVNFVIGPMGAGKTTYVKKHAKPNEIIIDWDDIREALNDECNYITSLTVADMLETCVRQELDCWVSAIVPNQMELNAIKGANVNWIYIDAPKDKVIRNRRKRNRHNIEKETRYESMSLYYERNIRDIREFIEKNDIKVKTVVPDAPIERW